MKQIDARDFGTPERHRQSKVIQIALESERLQIAKAAFECVLDRYLDRAQIHERQHEAGIRLRNLWHRSVLPASTTGAYASAVSGGGDAADTAGARRKLQEALIESGLAVRSHDRPAMLLVILRERKQVFPDKLPWRLTPMGHIAVAVCGFDEWAGGTDRLMSLRAGLSELADYWQLEH